MAIHVMQVEEKDDGEVRLTADMVTVVVDDYGNHGVVIRVMVNGDERIRLGRAEISDTEMELHIEGKWS
jgi:hypothetical protein